MRLPVYFVLALAFIGVSAHAGGMDKKCGNRMAGMKIKQPATYKCCKFAADAMNWNLERGRDYIVDHPCDAEIYLREAIIQSEKMEGSCPDCLLQFYGERSGGWLLFQLEIQDLAIKVHDLCSEKEYAP